MIYTSAKDFFEKTAALHTINRELELQYAVEMKNGNCEAREHLYNGYIPTIAAQLKRLPPEYATLYLIYQYLKILDKEIDSFDFFQDSESFSHRLNWHLRNVTTRYTVDHKQ